MQEDSDPDAISHVSAYLHFIHKTADEKHSSGWK